jgi:hypothetical protein
MARVYVAGVCLLFMACAASAGAQDFKGIKLGASQDDACTQASLSQAQAEAALIGIDRTHGVTVRHANLSGLR